MNLHLSMLLLVIAQYGFSQVEAYVLNPREGEALGPGRLIKASPHTGSRNVVLVIDSARAGFETTFHAHRKTDEFFYIIEGEGTVDLDTQRHVIGPGSVIFIPGSMAHNVKVSDTGPMRMLFFFDKPGTDEWFREAHEKFFSRGLPMSTEDCNRIGKKYGYVCLDR
jgi:mannose-6-phosphate isomerase-like protein (cupin superfamily)